MSTLAQLRSYVTDEIQNDPSLRVSSATLIDRNLNRALDRLQSECGYDLPENLDVFTTTDATQEVNLPSDFVRIADPNGVKSGSGTPIVAIEYTQLLQMFDLSSTSGQPMYYYVRNVDGTWKIGFYPIPQGTTITVPYNKKLPTMTSGVNSPLSDDYDEALVTYATYLTMRRIKGYEEKANRYFQMYKDAANYIKSSRMNYNSQALSFDGQRFSNGQFYSPLAFTGYPYYGGY